MLVNTTLDIPVNLPKDDVLELDQYLGRGLQLSEVEFPEDQLGKLTFVPAGRTLKMAILQLNRQ